MKIKMLKTNTDKRLLEIFELLIRSPEKFFYIIYFYTYYSLNYFIENVNSFFGFTKIFFLKKNKIEIISQDMDMKRIKIHESVRTRDERESCFPELKIGKE